MYILKYIWMMGSYRLDRTAFKAQTAEEASNHAAYYKNLTWQERFRIANYLNSVAYNYPENEPPRLDRTVFRAWSMEEKNKYYNNI